MQLRAKSISVFLMCALVMASVGWPVSAVGKRASHSNAVKDLALTASYDTTTGTLRGYVREPESAPGIPGAGIPGVVVRATNTETGNQRSVRTNLEGFYFISLLPVGKYIISAEKDGLVLQGAAKPATINLNKTFVLVPDIILVPPAPPPPLAVNTPPPTPVPAPAPAPSAPPATGGQLTNQLDATRRVNADESQLLSLPLADSRTFDTLATLAAGVAPPPQVGGSSGPGIGAGIGTAGQFAVNGVRARANNFTVDGSDNNDEDVGVRRQGFTALVPQSIESVKEIQIVTSLWDAEAGRSSGSQVNAVSRSGSNRVHGTLYDFFNHDALNARNFFDYDSGGAPAKPLTATFSRSFINGQPQAIETLPVYLGKTTPILQANPSGAENPFQRSIAGGAAGFPLWRDRTFFFGSFERQDVKAEQETHFAVPTIAQRGFLGFGATGLAVTTAQRVRHYYPTTFAGDSAFSLFPFPNNPIGPYQANTYTQVLRADATATLFSGRVDHNFKAWGKDYLATGRYNFTDDERIIPVVGGAIFSSLIPRTGTQNLSLFLNSQLSGTITQQLRLSYGRTRLRFDERRDSYLKAPSNTGGFSYPQNEPFLLNAPLLINFNTTEAPAPYVRYDLFTGAADQRLGPLGQVIIAPFSPVGLNTDLFPQGRVNNTIQLAELLTQARGSHALKYGFDGRRTQLNSFLNRGYRPQVVYGGAPDLTALFAEAAIKNPSQFGPTPGFFSGTDLASYGLPTSISQALAINTSDSTIGLRFWQLNLFFNDSWQARRGLTLDYGLRYELNTVPREVNQRIEQTFGLDQLPANDPNLRLAAPFTGGATIYDSQRLLNSFDATLGAYRQILAGRTGIYDADRNNFSPHFSFAYDPFAGSSTQAGKTAVRAGFGLYYDLNLGSVVSQSRNVFPTFIPFNVDANTFFYARSAFSQFNQTYAIFNPTFVPVDVVNGTRRDTYGLIGAGQLNTLQLPDGILQQLLGLLFDPSIGGGRPSGGGLAFTLPDKRLRSPYTLQYNLQIERELTKELLANVAYVGTKGNRLTRFRTPNGGSNSITIPIDPLGFTGDNPIAAIALPPLGDLNAPRPTRPNPLLGAYTIFDSSAASNYHSLQASLTKRYSHGYQFTAAYTWSHAIDDVSDVFDLAGAYALPQDDRNLRAERASASFDIRHRFIWSLVAEVPFLRRLNNAAGAAGFLFGNWQIATLSSLQTGQPFTVNTSYDINLDGNLTDRLDTLTGLQVLDERQQRLALAASPTSLLAGLGQNGRNGRNAFRGAGVFKTDLAVIKNFRFRNEQTLVFRVEAFNLWNRTHFALPVRVLEAPSFGRSTDTLFNARQIQFALKYVF